MIELERMSSLCVLGLLVVSPVFAVATPGQRDLATEVKAAFKAKSAECHGPQVHKPKGKFGYVLDLKRLAADPKKVVPSKPENSKLWQLVRDEEMPPEEAEAGQAMTGRMVSYDHLHSFYSDLFDLGIEAAGKVDARLETVADWKEPYREGVVYHMRDGRVRACCCGTSGSRLRRPES